MHKVFFFVTLVVCQAWNALLTRARRVAFYRHLPVLRSSRNLWLFPAVAFELCAAAFIVYTPGITGAVRTGSVPAEFWGLACCYGFVLWCLDEIRKAVARKFPAVQKFMW